MKKEDLKIPPKHLTCLAYWFEDGDEIHHVHITEKAYNKMIKAKSAIGPAEEEYNKAYKYGSWYDRKNKDKALKLALSEMYDKWIEIINEELQEGRAFKVFTQHGMTGPYETGFLPTPKMYIHMLMY